MGNPELISLARDLCTMRGRLIIATCNNANAMQHHEFMYLKEILRLLGSELELLYGTTLT
jgi:hypothetical protein